jgi:hypothetical protein
MKGRRHPEDLDVDWRIILKCILRKWWGSVWTEFIWLRTGTDYGFCELGNKRSGSMKDREFVD